MESDETETDVLAIGRGGLKWFSIHFADGFEETEAVTIVDVLRRAGEDAVMVSVTGSLEVRGAHGICVIADLLFEDADYENCDMIVLPGGMPGTTNLAAHQGLVGQIRDFAGKGKWVAAICAAPMILGDMSLLKGKKATIYPGMEDHLAGAELCADRVVPTGNIVTSMGPGTAMEFALKLAELLVGEKKAADVRKALLI